MKLSSITPFAKKLRARQALLCATVVLFVLIGVTRAQVYVVSGTNPNNVVGKYDADSGGAINTSFSSGQNILGIFLYNNVLYVTNSAGTLAEYDATNGATINASFLTGLANPRVVARSGNILYVLNGNTTGAVGLYDATSGSPITSIPLSTPHSLAVLGSTLYIGYGTAIGFENIGTYDATTGAVINSTFITGLSQPISLAAANNTLYVDEGSPSVGTYNATTGAPLNTNFITTAGISGRIALSSDNLRLYVTYNDSNKVAEYDANSGATINSNLIAGLTAPNSIAVGIPEPTTALLLTLGLGFGFGARRRQRSRNRK